MSKKVAWGVIGSGGIAWRRTIPEGIVPARNARLAGVWGRNGRTNAAVAREFGAVAAGSLEELLGLGLDAVYVASPNHLHVEQVLAAARAGVHVFCEKPLGMDVVEARRMVTACRRAGVNLGTAFMMRYHSRHQAALRLIEEGRLGQVVYARAQLSCWYPPAKGAWRQERGLAGGGALMDLAGHCLDLLEMFFGPIVSVSSMIGNTVHNYSTEDSGVTLARFRNGATATVDTLFCMPDVASKNRLELYGTGGSILAEGTIGQGSGGEMVAWLEKGKRVIAPRPVNTYRAEIEAFSAAILEGRDTKESAEAGLRSQVVLEACYESARRKKEVAIRTRISCG
jgi:predicted dehydrogenase